MSFAGKLCDGRKIKSAPANPGVSLEHLLASVSVLTGCDGRTLLEHRLLEIHLVYPILSRYSLEQSLA